MAKDKERSINPAQAQRKAEKAKALKKGKAQVQSQRNEKLARRNPERLQRQIDDLKALESSGDIKSREKAILEELERDVRAIRKARDALGDRAPVFHGGAGNRADRDGNKNLLGKRTHDGERKQRQYREPSESDTDEDVRKIPMPRDTPPPLPRSHHHPTRNANHEPLGAGSGPGERTPHDLPPRPVTVAQTTYSSAPQIRDLKHEATARFVPNVVRMKQQAVKGVGGGLLEPEDLDQLEREGYIQGRKVGDAGEERETNANATVTAEGRENTEANAEAQRLAEEEARFQRELDMEMEAEAEVEASIPDLDPDPDLASDPGAAEAAAAAAPHRRHVYVEEMEDEDI